MTKLEAIRRKELVKVIRVVVRLWMKNWPNRTDYIERVLLESLSAVTDIACSDLIDAVDQNRRWDP